METTIKFQSLIAGSISLSASLVCANLHSRRGWSHDPRFTTVTERFANGGALMEEFRKRTVNFSTDDLVAQMEEAQVPCAKVNDYDEVITDPRVTHRGSIIEYDHPLGGRVRQPRPAAIFDGEPCGVRLPAPALGENTDEIFTALGYSLEELTELRKAGALG